MTKFIDISHIIEDGMITYPGLPGPKIRDHMSHEDSKHHYGGKTTFQIGKIEMVANTGTYIDAPFHRYIDGKDLSQLDLASVANLDGVLFHADPAAHTILLDGGIPIIEHLYNLDTLPDKGFKFFAVPAPVKGMGSFPVRAFAIIDQPFASLQVT